MKRSLALLFIVIFLLTALAGCQPTSGEVKTEKVVYLINGALGDNGFYDSGKAGIDKIAKQYGLETRTIECNFDAGKYQPALQAAVDYADVIFVISYGYEDQLKEMANKYPNKIFVNIDTVVQNSKNTITSVDFIEEESAYLTGVVAALVTTESSIPNINPEKVIGVVGGDTDPVISAYVWAYENGARSIAPDIQVLKVSLGGAWDDTAKDKQATLQLFDQGADIVFQAAGAASLGGLQAARERNLYAIGVDTNQNDLEPGHVVASDIKDVGMTIETVFKSIKDGKYKPGQTLEFGLATGAVDVVFEAKVQVLPQSLVDKVKDIRQQIIDGKLKIERYNGQKAW